jgi:hypothetical protein
MNCFICKKEIKRYLSPGDIKRNKHFFCGRKCYEFYWIQQRTGEKNYRWKGGKIDRICNFCKKIYSTERYLKNPKFCSRDCSVKGMKKERRFNFTKERNPKWKGGISKGKDKYKNSEYYYKWRNKVFRRDRWTCKICGFRSKASKAHGDKTSDIHAHHIIPLSQNIKLSLKTGNGITLCIKCHRLTYGKENNFITVFKGILNDYMSNIPKG